MEEMRGEINMEIRKDLKKNINQNKKNSLER
jgi:hypothetical protein